MASVHTTRPRRRGPTLLMATGCLFVAAAVLWWLFAVPALVKYPTDVDVSPRYEGSLRLFADPETFAPLAEPLAVPLTIERHLEAVGDESGSSRVLVRETLVQKAGQIDLTQENVYVLDRRSMENVADDRAYAFDETNVADRSGSYRLQLPMDLDESGTYEIYSNNIGDTYRLEGTGDSYEAAGLTLDQFRATLDYTPVAEAFLDDLRRAVALPEELTIQQLQPQLQQLGIDVTALAGALAPVVSPADAQVLAQLGSQAVPLVYVYRLDGTIGVEPRTGTEVDVSSVTEVIAVRPNFTALAPLLELLARYPQEPAALAAGEALEVLAGIQPTPVAEFSYGQTDASVADIAAEAKDQRDLINLAERLVPIGLLAVGGLLILVGVFLYFRRPREEQVVTLPPSSTARSAPERPLVGSRR